jgi:serine/threonine protein kinase
MTPLTPSQFRRFDELLEALATATPSQAESLLAGESDERVARLVRLARAWRRDALEEFTPGFRFDGLELIERLGEGGLGVVWRASQALPGGPREVAVKFIRPFWLRKGPATVQRVIELFEQEVRLVAGLSHPHIVPVYCGGRVRPTPRQPEMPWVAMKCLRASAPLIPDPGTPDADLHARLFADDDPAKALEKKLRCFAPVADAVAHAHARGVRHLDLTPANIRVLPGGQAKVIDFGLGALHEALRPHRPELIGNGTLPYRAPEQFDPQFGAVGAATDVHALGVLLYQFLTGQLPYEITNRTPDDEAEIQSLICSDERVPLPQPLARKLPGLQNLLDRALQRDADERTLTAAELAKGLRGILGKREQVRRPKPADSPQALISVTGGVIKGDVIGVGRMKGTLNIGSGKR